MNTGDLYRAVLFGLTMMLAAIFFQNAMFIYAVAFILLLATSDC